MRVCTAFISVYHICLFYLGQKTIREASENFFHEAPLLDIEKSGAAKPSVILTFLPVSMLSQARVR